MVQADRSARQLQYLTTGHTVSRFPYRRLTSAVVVISVGHHRPSCSEPENGDFRPIFDHRTARRRYVSPDDPLALSNSNFTRPGVQVQPSASNARIGCARTRRRRHYFGVRRPSAKRVRRTAASRRPPSMSTSFPSS